MSIGSVKLIEKSASKISFNQKEKGKCALQKVKELSLPSHIKCILDKRLSTLFGTSAIEIVPYQV